jgi:hypothetical protein
LLIVCKENIYGVVIYIVLKHRLIFGLYIVMLMIMFIASSPSVHAKEGALEASPILIQNTLDELALYEQELNLSSSPIELEYVRELYHTDDSILGYYYQIFQNNTLKGYVLISEKDELGTTIELGSFVEGIDNKYGEILNSNKDQKAYYLSLDDIIIADDLSALKFIIEEAQQEMIEELNEQNQDKELINLYQDFNFGIDIEKAAQEERSIVRNSTASNITPQAVTTKLSVPYLSQYNNPNIWYPNSSCGPVAAAMIVKYYNEVRGLNVRNYPASSTVINSLYNIMNSRVWGTNQYSFHNGGQAYFNLNQNLFVARSRVYGSSTMDEPSFINVKNAINKRYPLAVIRHADVSQIWSGQTGYHWIVIYQYHDASSKVVYQDPAKSEGYHSISFSSLAGKIGYTYFALK